MNESPLPDDLAHWPEDPNELLGISFGVTPRDLRRAYNRLIRIYKPEQYPEQFRRIREAYEHLLRIAELFSPRRESCDAASSQSPQSLPLPAEPASDDDTARWSAGEPRPLEETTEEDASPARMRHPEEELDELWEKAVAGCPAAVYQRLVHLTHQFAGRVVLYQRLYWLLTLWPDLDTERKPADWLVQGLTATGLDGALRELYREEVADDPSEAFSERYELLLDASPARNILAELIEWRFHAAVRLGQWDCLDRDLERLRPRFDINEEELWLRLLLILADRVAWPGDAEDVRLLVAHRDAIIRPGDVRERWKVCERLLACCRDEIAQHEHPASNLAHLFDRMDLLGEASPGWFKLCIQSHVPLPMLQLLGTSWSRPFGEVRGLLLSVLELMAANPPRWLDHLDEMHEIAPATLALLGELIDRFEEVCEMIPEGARDSERLKGLALSFLPQLNVAGYEGERTRLLMYCIREDIAPEAMAEVASSFTGGWEELGTTWARLLMKDWPLRHVCRACRLFWA